MFPLGFVVVRFHGPQLPAAAAGFDSRSPRAVLARMARLKTFPVGRTLPPPPGAAFPPRGCFRAASPHDKRSAGRPSTRRDDDSLVPSGTAPRTAQRHIRG
jgi:hypothetical protein